MTDLPPEGLNSLYESADRNKELYAGMTFPDASILEHFAIPQRRKGALLGLDIETREFTSLCPVTGQPDFATIKIRYTPNSRCVESKSLKLYLLGYRNHGDFHEACVTRIGEDLVTLLDPVFLEVVGEFTPRGGLPFWPTYSYAEQVPPSLLSDDPTS